MRVTTFLLLGGALLGVVLRSPSAPVLGWLIGLGIVRVVVPIVTCEPLQPTARRPRERTSITRSRR